MSKNQPCDVIKVKDYPSLFKGLSFPLLHSSSSFLCRHMADFWETLSPYVPKNVAKCWTDIVLLYNTSSHRSLEGWCHFCERVPPPTQKKSPLKKWYLQYFLFLYLKIIIFDIEFQLICFRTRSDVPFGCLLIFFYICCNFY